jgi:hypothetical protein
MIVPDASARCAPSELVPLFHQRRAIHAKCQRFASIGVLTRSVLTRNLVAAKSAGAATPSMKQWTHAIVAPLSKSDPSEDGA